MRLSLRAGVVLVSALASSVCLRADTFNFNYLGSGVTASGVLTGSVTSSAGVFLISSITGVRNGLAITGLNTTYGDPDELLYFPAKNTDTALTPTFLDNSGLSFNVGAASYNLFTSVNRPTVVENEGGPGVLLSVTQGSAVAPEPTTLLLLSTGLASGLVLMRRRRGFAQSAL